MATLQPPPRPNGSALTAAEGPRSVVDQVTDSILALILAGEIPPGQPVAIRDLGERLNVSHVPVREALRRLESQGLIIFRRGRRPQIAPIDAADFEALFTLRSAIEADVALRSAELVTAEHVREVEELYDELKTLMLDGAAQHVYPVHSNFHLALLPGASHWDRQVLDQLWTATERYIQLYVLGAQRDPASTELILQAHAQLVDVIRNPTPNSLRAAVIDHIQLSHDLIFPLIQDASGHA